MSEETPEAPQQTVQGQSSTSPCQRCNKEMVFGHPKAEFLNGTEASTIAVIHSPTQCPHCGLRYITQVLGMSGMKFRWLPIPDNDVMLGDKAGEREKEPTIVAPGQRPKGIVRKSGLIIPG